jgi:hypothetical protein
MLSKKEGTFFLIFALFCILATGFYDQVFDDNNFSETDQICEDGYEAFGYSLCKVKYLLGGIQSFQTLRPATSFYFLEIIEKASFESASFFSYFTYRAPPVKS